MDACRSAAPPLKTSRRSECRRLSGPEDYVKEDRAVRGTFLFFRRFWRVVRVTAKTPARCPDHKSTARGDRVDHRALNRASGEAEASKESETKSRSEVLSQATKPLESR